MEFLNCLLWTSAACVIVGMALDGTFLEVGQYVCWAYRRGSNARRAVKCRALACLLHLLAMVFEHSADRMETGCAVSRFLWGHGTYWLYRLVHRPIASAVETNLPEE